jgi:hypothetical protein
MSALGQERTFHRVQAMSVILPKADIRAKDQDVPFVPKADIRRLIRSPRPQWKEYLAGR